MNVQGANEHFGGCRTKSGFKQETVGHALLQRVGKCAWLFFFSSRRRHTICSRDWSSDVCSSDLCKPSSFRRPRLLLSKIARAMAGGSEERRVGKECRSQSLSYQSINN